MNMRSTTASWMAAIVFVLFAGLGRAVAAPPGSPWGAGYFPNVPLVNQDGKTLRFYDDLIKDKVVAINFIYTSCGDMCPLETAKLRQVQQMLGELVGKEIFFYSISIDPERDTPEVLKKFMEKFEVGPGWQFLTGKKEDITLLRKKLGLLGDEIEVRNLSAHRASMLLGNEATGVWMKRSPYENTKLLTNLLGHRLLNRSVVSAQGQSYAAADHRAKRYDRGEYLFRTRCAVCHTVGGGDGLGPDLLGVTDRRDPAWLARWVKEPSKMLAEKDPIAMALLAQYKDLPMPTLGLNDQEVGMVIDYLKAETLRLAQDHDEHEHHHHHHHAPGHHHPPGPDDHQGKHEHHHHVSDGQDAAGDAAVPAPDQG